SAEKMKQFLEHHEIDMEDLKTWEKHVEEEKIRLVKKGQLGLYPGTQKLLESLDVPKALVSNAYAEATDELVKYLGLDEHFEFWKAPHLDDIEAYVESMKPNPDMLEEAMKVMDSEKALMVGDSDSDVKAAENAGIDSVYIDRSGRKSEKATFNVESLEEVGRIVKGEA
ncbi:MAG: HAD family hydrolase, partial [Candidatus Nanohalobium sp.]